VNEGEVAAGAPFALAERRHARWTIERANRVMYAKLPDAAERAELASLPELSASWRAELRRQRDIS
jgi:MOSC domain-containing protein YiiM